jgi:hypothetical protein
MGYNITAVESTLRIPAEYLDEALLRFKALNHNPDVEKRGGSSTGEKWFSWMAADYDQHVTSAKEVLDDLGFYTEIDKDNGDVVVTGYDSKTGQEELFLDEIANLVDPDCYIIWVGEDLRTWAWTTDGRKDVTFTIVD